MKIILNKKFFITVVLTSFSFTGFAQQLPLNTCGIVNVYDGAGSRTKRQYFCNIGTDPYPSKEKSPNEIASDVQLIDALYPNPTTGKFYVTFSKAFKDALVYITDVNGKVIIQFRASGYKVNFDLSSVAPGVYFVRINDAGIIISKKVIKQ